MNQERLLKWLNKEKVKDKVEIDSEKKKFIEDIRKISKEELFYKKKKLTLWNKIKVMIWGH